MNSKNGNRKNPGNRNRQLILGLLIALSALGFQLLILFGAFQKLGLSGGGESALLNKIITVLGSGTAVMDIILFILILLVLHLLAGLLTVVLYRLAATADKWRGSLLYFSLFSLLCWFCLAGWATIIFPYSRQSDALDLLFTYNVQYRYLLFATSLVIILVTGLSALRRAIKFVFYPQAGGLRLVPAAFLTAAIVGVLAIYGSIGSYRSAGSGDADLPDVYIIGIDSLNLGLLESASTENLPALKGFLQTAVVFDRVSTPLARTFPAWVSVLSGNYPITSGVRINLQPRDQIATEQLISRRLQSIGYKTYYSTDETRFANIDQSYGFDRLFASRQGALDFLIGTFNDFWLSNFLVNSSTFGHLFPYNYLNRAAFHHYLPATYSSYLRRRMNRVYQLAAIDQDPLFFAIHLCTPHWPYTITPDPDLSSIFNNVQLGTDRYTRALEVINQQLSSILESIRQSGRYEQSWIFLISDHGEELLGNSSRLLTADNREAVRFGHGTDVLSDEQYGVLLAIKAPRGFSSRFKPDTGVNTSLVDIAPTIADITGIEATMDGVSLLAATNSAHPRVILRESGYTPTSIGESGVTEAALINSVADFYTTTSDGRFEFKSELLPEIFRTKSRAIEFGNTILGLEYQHQTESWQWRLRRGSEKKSFLPDSTEALAEQEMIGRFCNHWGTDLAGESVCSEVRLK